MTKGQNKNPLHQAGTETVAGATRPLKHKLRWMTSTDTVYDYIAAGRSWDCCWACGATDGFLPASSCSAAISNGKAEEICSTDYVNDMTRFKEWIVPIYRDKLSYSASLSHKAHYRDLKLLHKPEFDALHHERKQARKAFEQSPDGKSLQGMERKLKGLQSRYESIVLTKKKADWEDFANKTMAEMKDLEAKIDTLKNNSAVTQRYMESEAQLATFSSRVGLTKVKEDLRDEQAKHGQTLVSKGRSFEEETLHVIEESIVQKVMLPTDVYLDPSSLAEALFQPTTVGNIGITHSVVTVLTSVKLGAAKTEFDAIVLRLSDIGSGAGTSTSSATLSIGRERVATLHVCDILAVIETKMNINDIGHGFDHRQNDLAFFCQDLSLYEQEDYRSKAFPNGVFDRPGVHEMTVVENCNDTEGQDDTCDTSSYRPSVAKPKATTTLRFIIPPEAFTGTAQDLFCITDTSEPPTRAADRQSESQEECISAPNAHQPLLAKKSKFYLKPLYFITRDTFSSSSDKPRHLIGMKGSDLFRVIDSMAGDIHMDLASEEYLSKIHAMVMDFMASTTSTRDVFRYYAQANATENIIFVKQVPASATASQSVLVHAFSDNDTS